MRILWVKMGGLWPLTSGGRQRSFHMAAELARRHQVTIVTTHGPGEDGDRLAVEMPHCERVVSVPFEQPRKGSLGFASALIASWFSRYPVDLWKWTSPAVREAVAAEVARKPFDVVIADFLTAMPNLKGTRKTPVVMFEHNVEYLIWKRLCRIESSWWRRLLLQIEWRKLRRCEARACRDATVTIAVSEDDRARLAELAPGARVMAVPTGTDVNYFRPNGMAEVPNRLVFSGSMDWYPNEDAMVHFVENILPLVRREVPDATLTIVGRQPSAAVKALGQLPGIHVTGTVADVRPHVLDAPVYIVPLRAGGGTRLKIFEALAMARAVVSTTVGAEGLGLISGQHAVLADTPESFSRAVVDLLRDPARRASLGAEGRRLVDEHHSWASVTRVFEAQLREAERLSLAPAVQDAGRTTKTVWAQHPPTNPGNHLT
jgi:glycosyltransferase involved in cell wall biosynthesis